MVKARSKTLIGYCSPRWYKFFFRTTKTYQGQPDNRVIFPHVRAKRKDKYGVYRTKLQITFREIRRKK